MKQICLALTACLALEMLIPPALLANPWYYSKYSARYQYQGGPPPIRRRAIPSEEPRDTGYYVGGGAAFRGEPRYYEEGTWGWDYSNPVSHVMPGWWHGRRYQGGPGQYQPNRVK